MLFNSLPFVLAFFPITVIVFFIVGHSKPLLAGIWLCGASLFFYGWWNATFVGLLLVSVIFNYCAGYLISCQFKKTVDIYGRPLLVVAIATNLLLLAYFKYAGFLSGVVTDILGEGYLKLGDVFLPLGISFFTFTQIAFLVDTYQGKVRDFNCIHYTLFVTYFPHLIAGPILHHSQMMPQFAERRIYRVDWLNTSVGLTIFVIGL